MNNSIAISKVNVYCHILTLPRKTHPFSLHPNMPITITFSLKIQMKNVHQSNQIFPLKSKEQIIESIQ
jgi:hypothetical protein